MPVAKRDGYYAFPTFVVAGIKVLESKAGDVSAQDMSGFTSGQWQDNNQLWWQGAHPGDTLKIAVPVKSAGKHRLDVGMTKAKDYAIVQLYLDGKKVGSPVDLYNASDVIPSTVMLGVHDLTAGTHRRQRERRQELHGRDRQRHLRTGRAVKRRRESVRRWHRNPTAAPMGLCRTTGAGGDVGAAVCRFHVSSKRRLRE